MNYSFINIKNSVLIVAGIIILAVAVLIFLFVSAILSDKVALGSPVRVLHNPLVTWVEPEAEVRRNQNGDWSELEAGNKLGDDDIIRTGLLGNVDISFSEGTLVRVAEDSIMKISDVTLSRVNMSLQKGTLISKFSKITGDEKHEIVAGSVVCGIRGTELIVEIGENNTIVYGMSGETEVASVDHPENAVLIGFQQKTVTESGKLPESPVDMTPDEITRFRRILDSMHKTEVLFVATDLKFKPDSAELLSGSAQGLAQIARTINSKKLYVEIVGHTADIGDRASQYELSRQRAEAVKEVLISLGVKEKYLTTKGYGGVRPVADNSTPEGRARNRRVEFLIKE